MPWHDVPVPMYPCFSWNPLFSCVVKLGHHRLMHPGPQGSQVLVLVLYKWVVWRGWSGWCKKMGWLHLIAGWTVWMGSLLLWPADWNMMDWQAVCPCRNDGWSGRGEWLLLGIQARLWEHERQLIGVTFADRQWWQWEYCFPISFLINFNENLLVRIVLLVMYDVTRNQVCTSAIFHVFC